jgi:hypothetical protein
VSEVSDGAPHKPFSADDFFPQLATSYPSQIVRHNISDEELDMLCEQRRDHVREYLWVALGAMAGAFPAALGGLVRYFFGEDAGQLPIDALAQVIIFFVGGVVAAVTWHIQADRGNAGAELKDAIRARTKKQERWNTRAS